MDKNAIKKYAVWARKELISRVAQKAQQYGITETEMVDAGADSVNGKVLSAEEMQQRRALIAQINEKGYQQVMEEVAYTWFNRFSALRFMEVNGYLPSHVRVFTDENNAFKPQILAEALHLELDKLDKDKVYALKETEQTEELYKYLLIVQCNALNSILPGMFQTIADYTELLLPDNLLREGSVIEQMISQIPEDNWQDAVQIIGWLYQYYNSEKKDDVFAALKKNVKITKENIPAATQLFTPDWIVRYMVENSLGRLWVEGHPDAKAQLLPTPEEQAAYTAGNRDPEDTKWHYYLEEAQQEPQVQAQLSEISKQYADLTPEQIKVIDPCCGSGHILAYTFEEKFVSVPEQGGGKLIPDGMCNPGQVYTVSRGKSGMIGVFRLESQMLPGSGKFERTGLGSDRDCKESTNTAFNFLKANGKRISGGISTASKDYIINYQDLQGIGMTGKLALPTLIALCSIALGRPTVSTLAVLGEISISGTILKVDELANSLQVCLDSGAKKVLLPITSAADLGTVPPELVGSFNLIFYSSAEDAVFKALGVE